MLKNLNRLLRWTTGALSAVIVICIAIIIFGDLSTFRGTAEKRASEALGAPVQILGDMRLRPSFPPVVELNDVIIKNPPESQHDAFLSAENVYVTIALGSLFSGSVEISKAALSSFELNIERGSPVGDTDNSSLDGSLAGSIELTDGVIRWIDPTRGEFPDVYIDRAYSVFHADSSHAKAELEVRGQSLRIAARADAIGHLFDAKPWEIEIDVNAKDWSLKADGKMTHPPQGQFSLYMQASTLSSLNELHGLSLPSLGPVKMEATVSTSVQSLKSESLRIGIGETELSGEIEVRINEPHIGIRATIETPKLQLADFADLPEFSDAPNSTDFMQAEIPLANLQLTNVDIGIFAKSLLFHYSNLDSALLRIASNAKLDHGVQDSAPGSDASQSILSVVLDDDLPRFKLQNSATALNLGDDVPGSKLIAVSGQAVNAEFDITASGKTWDIRQFG